MDSGTKAELLARLRDRNARAKRARDDVRAARERLSRGNQIKPEFEYELLTMFARNELGAAVTIWALSVIFALASMFWAPWLQGCLWLVFVILAKVLLLELCRRFLAAERAEAEIGKWRRRFVAAEFLNGIGWAGFALIGIGSLGLPGATLFSSHIFIFAALIVLIAVRMTLSSMVMGVLYAGTVPMALAVAARLISLGDPFYVALATMAVGVHVYFLFLARGLQQTAVQMFEFRAEKDILIAELEEEKLTSDAARKRAEAASKAKSRFLATMSHELRTPLNAIMGFSEVMRDEVLGKHAVAAYRDYAADINDSGRHLLQLISEILDISRIEAGRYELHEERSHLGDIAQDCHRLLKLKAQAKGLEVIEEIAPDLPQLWVDPRAMRQICLNLLSNAIKFTPRGGRVTIRISVAEDGGQVLSVKDTGPGIPQDEIPKVLQAFGQGSLAHETAEGGTGLGLPIVNSLIELHGGTFELKSELRRGTEVIVTVPRQRVLAELAPLQPLGEERHRRREPADARSARPSRLRGVAQAQGGLAQGGHRAASVLHH